MRRNKRKSRSVTTLRIAGIALAVLGIGLLAFPFKKDKATANFGPLSSTMTSKATSQTFTLTSSSTSAITRWIS